MSYTKEMEAQVVAAAPVTKEVAEALSGDLGVSAKSVIAKAVTLGVYQKAEPSKAKRVRKADLVAQIEDVLEMQGALASLERASAAELTALLVAVTKE